MTSHYGQLTLEDRRQIYRLRDQKVSVTEIAARLGRHRSTIYREIQRNTFLKDDDGYYDGYFPVTAHDLAQARRTRKRKLLQQEQLRRYVIEKLESHWSPDQISGYLRRHESGFYVCPETIYQYVYSAQGKEQGLYRHLFRGKSKRRPRFGRRARGKHIPAEHTIHQRPALINDRQAFGHWECDLMMFQKDLGTANVTSLVERKSRYMFLAVNDSRTSRTVMSGIVSRIGKLPSSCRQTITFDRDTEFMAYPLLRRQLGMHSYFCDPQKPWQKGAVENNNGRIRRYLPANTNVAELPESALREICKRMNRTPRKCLGYRTPEDVFFYNIKSAGPV